MPKQHLLPDQRKRLAEAVSRFPNYRVLVVGDLMLDVFVWGEVNRISPEAPVPVVEVREETQLLGGSANVVNNVAALGGKAAVSGVIGDDSRGRELLGLLRQVSVPTEGVIVEHDRPTTMKTRVIAQNQQVVRYDRERRSPIGKDSLGTIISYIRESMPEMDAMIVSDYAKGVVTADFMESVRSLDVASKIPVVVDPKAPDAQMYRRVTMVTPNHQEASRMADIDIHDEISLMEAGRRLLERIECKSVLITRGKEGMSLFDEGGEMAPIPTVAKRVFDVTGAGDTVIATITLGIVSGLSLVDAALLANIAAGIVVGEVGTAVVTAERLLAEIANGG